MIHFKCTKCGYDMEAPEELRGKALKCPNCGLHEKVEGRNPDIELINQINQKTKPQKYRNAFVAKIWIRSPAAFKNAFLATLGVISALLLCLYVYGHIFSYKGFNDIGQAKALLAKQRLFPINTIGQSGILRGRTLNEYKFTPDATYSLPFLSLWTDETNAIIGVSCLWLGDKSGSPAEIIYDDTSYSRHSAVCNGFYAITGFDLNRLTDKDFIKDASNCIYTKQHNNWWIQIMRYQSIFEGTKSYKKRCADKKIYSFTATAQQW